MAYREFHYRWEWQLRSNPDELWPFVADTNRFNRDTGVPAVENNAGAGERLNNSRRRLRLHKLGLTVEWEEQPFEWIRPFRFGVVRRYTKGPVAQLRVQAELTPQPGGGTQLVYEVWAQPRTALGLTAIPAQIGFLSRRNFETAIRRYDKLAASGTPSAALTMPATTQAT
ncbi:MAG: SRPBCC family protein, partial [Pyrinomonadaceae bacterium]